MLMKHSYLLRKLNDSPIQLTVLSEMIDEGIRIDCGYKVLLLDKNIKIDDEIGVVISESIEISHSKLVEMASSFPEAFCLPNLPIPNQI